MHRAASLNLSLGYTSVWGGKSLKFHGEMKQFVGQGADAQRELAEFEPRVDLSMGRKIIEIPEENDGFWGSWGPTHSADSQNLSLG